MSTLRSALLAWPGRLETPGSVKRRLLLVASVMAIAVAGTYEVSDLGGAEPWTGQELRDLAGLPRPPAPFVQEPNGDLRQLSPEEYAQLQEIRGLIERFPVPDEFATIPAPQEDAGTGSGGGSAP